MKFNGRRMLAFVLRIVGRDPNDYAQELQDWAENIHNQVQEGIPAGFNELTPVIIQAGQEGTPGSEGDGWMSASARPEIETASPSNPTGTVASEGSGTALMRADAVVKQGIVTTHGDLLGHNATVPARVPGPPTSYNANGWPYLLKGGGADLHVQWDLPWNPTVQVSLTDNVTTDIMRIPIKAVSAVDDPFGSVHVQYGIHCHNDTDVQSETGRLTIGAVRDSAGTLSSSLTVEPMEQNSPVGTLVVTWSLFHDTANNRIVLRLNANTSLAPTTFFLILDLKDTLWWDGILFPFSL